MRKQHFKLFDFKKILAHSCESAYYILKQTVPKNKNALNIKSFLELSSLLYIIELIQLKANPILVKVTITNQILGRLLPKYKDNSYLA